MSSNLFGGRFMSVRVPAWHNLGKVLEDHPETVEDAFKIAELGYEIHKVPLYARLPGNMQTEVTERKALMREPTGADSNWAYLGVVSNEYEPLQNMELAKILDAIGLAKKWPIETVGALGDGETIFASFMDGKHRVLGLDSEELDLYFLLSEQRDGKSALKLSFTPVRVVCKNTLAMGLAEAITTINVKHLIGAAQQVTDRVKLLAGLDETVKDTLSLFDKLAAFGIKDKFALEVIAKAYPKPIKPKRLRDAESIAGSNPDMVPTTNFAGLELSVAWATETLTDIGHTWERESARVETLRTEAFDLYHKFNDEQPKVAQTGWAVVNAVVEAEDFRDGPQGMFESTLWGARAKTKAAAMKAVLTEMGVK